MKLLPARTTLLAVFVLFGFGLSARAAQPRLADLKIPGDPAFVTAARDVLDALFAADPSIASNAGLFEDAVRAPSYDKAFVRRQVQRLDGDIAAMRKMPWRSWPVDRQVDFRWIYASAETLRHQLGDERLWVHRPASWLEPFANNLIAFASYRPEDTAIRSRIWALAPGMVREIGSLSVELTRRDRETARKLAAALIGMADRDGTPEAKAASMALASCDAALAALQPKGEFAVIGARAYAWRYRHALLLDVTPEQLLAAAQKELTRVDREIEPLAAKVKDAPAVAPTPDQQKRADAMTRDSLLALYDEVEVALREATIAAGFVTITDGVGPIRARETPEAMIPLTGDGGSMNPPPPFMDFNVSFWNVEHFSADWPADKRLGKVTNTENWRKGGFGTYAVHEGIPGHHLQLALARLHSNPLRNILQDNPMVEGWALYAEEEFWRHGGFGDSPESRLAVLRSYRARIARVFYDVNVESGVWTLQQAADFKHRAEPGKGTIDEDLLRSIQWPTQLIAYFTGKMQIGELKEAYRRKLGAAYTDRAFHDALLAEGSIPIALIRAKLLGEPGPGL